MMRKLLLPAFFLLTLAGNLSYIYSWDSTAAKYLPLQVGNVWVYRGSHTAGFMNGRSYQRYRVTGVIDSLGKKYYTIQSTITMISGTQTSGIWQLGNPVRIDSATMNVYALSPYCNNNETLMDSLRGRKNDSTIICVQQFYNANSFCLDTANYTIFNNSYPSKRFIEFMGPGHSTVYVKGIGIVYGWYGYMMIQDNDTLRGCVINGVLYGDTNTIVGINQISSEVPKQFSLLQNFPNPFNPITNVKFQIPKSGLVKLIVYNAIGEEVQTLVNEELSPGAYSADFDGTNLSSGVYYYKLESGAFTQTKKMILIK